MPLPKKMVDDLKVIVKNLPDKSKEAITTLFSQDAVDAIQKNKMAVVPKSKSFKQMIFNFFGMNDNWKLGRNLLGGFMVHAPEYPTYFMPAYTQSKATGDAKDLKKGEGPRGLITGALEGVAVGALVSGEFIKFREMGPYILLGAGLQMFSSTVFPWLGEKVGSAVYNRRMKNNAQYLSKTNDDADEGVFNTFSGVKLNNSKTAGASPYKLYNSAPSGNMKV